MNSSDIGDNSAFFYNILPGTILLVAISLAGSFGNGTIVLTTLVSKKLNSKCNALIAIMACADFITQIAHYIYAYFMFTGSLFQPLDFCFYIMSPSLMSLNFGTAMIWIIGIDRLLAATFPIQYMKWQKLPYILIMLSPAVVYSVTFEFIGWQSTYTNLTHCILPEAYGLAARMPFLFGLLLLNAMVISTYCYFAIVFRKQRRNQAASGTVTNGRDVMNRRLFKSIVIIMQFLVFGWFSNICVVCFAIALGASFETFFYYELYGGCGINVSIACNFYVYYYNSTDYRAAFKRLLCFWRRKQNVTTANSSSRGHGGGGGDADRPLCTE